MLRKGHQGVPPRMASKLIAMASTLLVMASNLVAYESYEPITINKE